MVKRTIVLKEFEDGSWTIDEGSNPLAGEGWPTVRKPTARQAVARLLQLLDMGPVAPQTTPERVCIGEL